MHSAEIASPPTTGARFQPIKKPDRKKKWATGSHAISALERKLQETLGQIKQLDEAEYEWDKRSGFALADTHQPIQQSRAYTTFALHFAVGWYFERTHHQHLDDTSLPTW